MPRGILNPDYESLDMDGCLDNCLIEMPLIKNINSQSNVPGHHRLGIL